MMRLKDAKATYGVSSTYYYKLKAKAGNDEKEFEKLLKEFKDRKDNPETKDDKKNEK